MLAAAVECVRALEPNPDAVLISGDLAARSRGRVRAGSPAVGVVFGAKEIEVSNDPPGFAVHTFIDGELISHTQPVQ